MTRTKAKTFLSIIYHDLAMDDASHARPWFWLATDQSLPTAEILDIKNLRVFVTCFWINPTGSCCWIGPASSWGIPSLSRDARWDRCDGWHAASRQILGVNETVVLLEPSLPSHLRNWTGLMKVCVCFFFPKNIEVNWEGEKNRQKKWIVAPSSRLEKSHWSEDD